MNDGTEVFLGAVEQPGPQVSVRTVMCFQHRRQQTRVLSNQVHTFGACRCDGDAEARETPIGYVPGIGALPTDGLDEDAVEEALKVDLDEARAELEQTADHLARFGDRLPAAISEQFEALKTRLG